MKIAIIGGTGLLGSNLIKLYSKYDVKGFSRSHSGNVEMSKNNIIDFNNLSVEINNYFNTWTPDIIINTVALVNLELCEKDINLANKINSNIAKEMSVIAKKYDAYFMHISTDHFYNDLIVRHSEKDELKLLNNYARTKYNAELEVSKVLPAGLIVRTNIIGYRRNKTDSFFEWLIQSLKKSETVNLYTNFFTSPIAVNALGELLLKCNEKKLSGIYNIGSSEVINKYDFGIKVAKKFHLSTENIVKSELSNELSKFDRALTLGLNVSKVEKALNLKMPTIDQTLNTLYKEYKE